MEGLPSYAPFNAANAGAVGPSDVSFADGRGYVTIGLAANPDLRTALGEKFGWIASFDRHGSVDYEVDVSAYEKQANPDLGPTESNPYGLVAGAGKRIVADAASNSLLQVSPSGTISTLAVFPSRFYPQAGSRPTDSVPDAVAAGPDGAYYVGELTGVPFTPDQANVWRVVPGQAPEVYCSGFSFIIDLTFDQRGNLYVLENASGPNGPFLSTPGQLLRVGRDCSRTPVATGLPAPTSVAIGPDGDAYLSINGTSAAIGEVVRVDLGGRHDDHDNRVGRRLEGAPLFGDAKGPLARAFRERRTEMRLAGLLEAAAARAARRPRLVSDARTNPSHRPLTRLRQSPVR